MSGAWRAFVVSIAEYDHLDNLPGARLDACRARTVLTGLGFDTICLEGHVTADQLDGKFGEFLQKVEQDAGSADSPVIFILASTHAIQVGEEDFPYLLASDAEKDADLGYDVREKVVMRFNKVRAKGYSSLRVILVFDCCRESSLDGTWKARAQSLPSLRNDFYILFACDKGRRARDTNNGGALVLALLTLLPLAEPITKVFEEAAQIVAQSYFQRPWMACRPGEYVPVLGTSPRSTLPLGAQSASPSPSSSTCKSSAEEPIAGAEPITVVLVGPTGHGKSAMGNSLAGRAVFVESDDVSSVTQAAQHVDISVCQNESETRWRIIDTIGFQDTALSAEEHVVRFVEFADRAPWGIDAFILVMRKERFTSTHLDVLRAFSEAAGATALDHTILAFSWGAGWCGDSTLKNRLMTSDNAYLQRAVEQVSAVVAVNNEGEDDRNEAKACLCSEVERLVAARRTEGKSRFSNKELVLARWRHQELRRLAECLRGERRAWLESQVADVIEGRKASDVVAIAAYDAVLAQQKEDAQQREFERLQQEEMERQEEQKRRKKETPEASLTWHIVGEGSISSHGFGHVMGKKEDFHYDVPEGATQVVLESEDRSQNGLNLGDGNGKATLDWSQGARTARVHAWVNGGLGKRNRITWRVKAVWSA